MESESGPKWNTPCPYSGAGNIKHYGHRSEQQHNIMAPINTPTTNDSTTDVPTSEADDCSLAEVTASTNKPLSTVQRWLRKGWLTRSGQTQGFTGKIRITRASLDALLGSGKLRASPKHRPQPAPVATTATIPPASATNPSPKAAELNDTATVPGKKVKRKSAEYKNAKRLLRRLPLPLLQKVEKWVQYRIANAARAGADTTDQGSAQPASPLNAVAQPLPENMAICRQKSGKTTSTAK
jgi:hypothetical protein